MNNVTIEPGSEIYKGSFSLKFTPKPEDKYVPKNYDEECICNGLRLLSEGKTDEGLGYLMIAWADEDDTLSFRYYKLGYEKALILFKKAEEGGFPAQEKLNKKP